jgi:SAM-dependent methyltransferase
VPASKASGYRYGEAFYRYIESGALRSPKAVIPLVLKELTTVSVLDVGCGAGAWLSEYQNHGISNYCGVDGAYRVVLLLPVWCVSIIALAQHSIVITYRSLRDVSGLPIQWQWTFNPVLGSS